MDYHVLSNYDMMQIGLFSILAASFLSIVFSGLGGRDASPTYKDGIIAKIVPWVLLIIFFSDVAVIISKIDDYSLMSIEQRPSQASAYREMQEMANGSPDWGYANDEQLAIVGKIGHCVCLLCWTVYAFSFKRSDTNWWKKLCKVIAYILLSILIVGFSIHKTSELWVMLFAFVLPSIILLKLAKVKKEAAIPNNMRKEPLAESVVEENTTENIKPINKEDASRFMPHSDGIDHAKEEKEVIEVESKPSSLLEEIETEHQPTAEDIHDEITNSQEISAAADNSLTINDFMYCKYCGKKIEADSSYCKYCGRKL